MEQQSLSELMALKKQIYAMLSVKKNAIVPIDIEINALKQQNSFLKKRLHQKELLVERINKNRGYSL